VTRRIISQKTRDDKNYVSRMCQVVFCASDVEADEDEDKKGQEVEAADDDTESWDKGPCY